MAFCNHNGKLTEQHLKEVEVLDAFDNYKLADMNKRQEECLLELCPKVPGPIDSEGTLLFLAQLSHVGLTGESVMIDHTL